MWGLVSFNAVKIVKSNVEREKKDEVARRRRRQGNVDFACLLLQNSWNNFIATVNREKSIEWPRKWKSARKRVANNELDIINNGGNQRVDIYETLFPMIFLVLVSFLIIYTSLTKLAILVPDFCGMNNKKKEKRKEKRKTVFCK